MSPRPAKPRRRMFWRIYLHGLVMLIAVALALGIAALATGQEPPWHKWPSRLAKQLASELADSADQNRLQTRVADLHQLSGIDLTVYGPDGNLLASAGSGTLDPLETQQAADLTDTEHFRGRSCMKLAAPMGPTGASGYLLLGWSKRSAGTHVLAVIAAVLAALALASWPLARAISKPLERLTQTAARLAEGDLSARTGLARRDEVGLLAGTMDQMAASLQGRILAERELLANVSHEIRTPLARLRVAIELLEEQDQGQASEKLTGMAMDLSELDSLLENVLLTARLDRALEGDQATGLVVRAEAIPAQGWLEQARSRFSRNHPGRQLQAEVQADLPPLWADPALLDRLLANLLDNAVKYSPKDAPVRIEALRSGAQVEIGVLDRGIGVEQADLERLFDPFFRTDRSRAKHSGGTGLGLALCKRIATALGGDIRAEAREGGGLALRVRLGNAPAPEGEQEQAQPG